MTEQSENTPGIEDEDAEGHIHTKAVEGDEDVEGHIHTKAVEGDDDVEGHIHTHS